MPASFSSFRFVTKGDSLYIKRGDRVRNVLHLEHRNNHQTEMLINIHEGDDLGQMFTDVEESCVLTTEYNPIICIISRLAFAEEGTEAPNLGALTGLASSIYWRHYAYSLPHRAKHNQTTSYYNHNALAEVTSPAAPLEEKSEGRNKERGEEIEGGLRYGAAEALTSSLADTLLRLEVTEAGEGKRDDEKQEENALSSSAPTFSSEPHSSLTIAITTCKRVHLFLPTFMALQEVVKFDTMRIFIKQ